MLAQMKKMLHDDDGAVTVDWVVLTGAIVLLGFAVIAPIGFNTSNAIEDVAGDIASVPDQIAFD